MINSLSPSAILVRLGTLRSVNRFKFLYSIRRLDPTLPIFKPISLSSPCAICLRLGTLISSNFFNSLTNEERFFGSFNLTNFSNPSAICLRLGTLPTLESVEIESVNFFKLGEVLILERSSKDFEISCNPGDFVKLERVVKCSVIVPNTGNFSIAERSFNCFMVSFNPGDFLTPAIFFKESARLLRPVESLRESMVFFNEFIASLISVTAF